MRICFLLIVLVSVGTHFPVQTEKDLIIVMIGDDRSELINSLKCLKPMNSQLVCLVVDLTCYKDVTDDQLSEELDNMNALIMPSQLRPFGTGKYHDIVGCSYLYPDEVPIGFTNLVTNEFRTNQADKIQIRNSFGQGVSYHMAVQIALSIDSAKTKQFVSSHPDTVAVELDKKRQFLIYNFDDVVKGRLRDKIKTNTIVILTTFSAEHFFVRESETGKLQRMPSSEIFANMAFKMIGE